MKNSRRSSANRQSVQGLAILAMFTSVILVLAFTPLGLIDLPFIKATILHVPVVIGAVLLGPRKGAFLGGVFGVASLIKNTIAPSALSFAFSPFMPVPGQDKGSLWALVICLVPRILVGVTPWLIYRLWGTLFSKQNKTMQTGGLAAAGIVGALTNTILVMGMIYLVFRQPYADIKGIALGEVFNVILGVVAANGVPELLVAAVLVPLVCLPLLKAMPHLNNNKN